MAKKNDHLADFATENTGGVLTGFLADEEHLDRRAMLRLGTWGAASVGAIIVALLANQSSLRLRHDELAAETLLPWTLPKTLLYPSFCTRLITTVYEQDCVVLGCELMLDAAFCIVMYNMLCLHEIK